MKRTLLGLSLLCISASLVLPACSSKGKNGKGVSQKTGWNYNDSRLGGFDVPNYKGQVTGPGLKFVEGGRFTMGKTQQDMSFEHNNQPRTVSVSSFYMDETEVTNVDYREYMYWLQRSYNADYPEIVLNAMPDTTVWLSALSYNEPLVSYYFRHAAYNFYPVVGVNWYQAKEYCKWRSNRVNEMILVKNHMLKKNPNQVNEDVYATDAYQAGQYLGTAGKRQQEDLDPNGGGTRNTNYSDGVLLPDYRLPTEAEWEYAALALVDKNPEPTTARRRGEEALTDRKNYPWGDFRTVRQETGKGGTRGEIMANFSRGRGDAMGSVGALNDNADRPAEVWSYGANAYGLYNMAGNVSEWTLDVYRANSSQDVEELNPYRGTIGKKPVYEPGEPGVRAEKDSLGNMLYQDIEQSDLAGRYDKNYRGADMRGIKDGDTTSGFVYDYGRTTLVNDDAIVIKGGSWKDRAYWLSPGSRRFMHAKHTSATVGFRCVMDRLGSPAGNGMPSGNYFDKKRRDKR